MLASAHATAVADVVFHARGLAKIYQTGEVEVQALRDVDLEIARGEFVVLLGASGSGKSTLLNILGGLDVPTRGDVRFGDHMLSGAGEAELTAYRREHVGFVFQFYNLIPSLTVRENLALVTDICKDPMAIDEAIALVGLGDISRLEVVAELLTTDAIPAQPGSRVVIERWGGPGTLDGRVTRVEPGAFTKVSALGVEEQRVRVLIAITSAAPLWKALGDAYRVSVRIITLARENAIQVPVSAVFPLSAQASTDASGSGNGGNDGNDAAPRHAVFVADGGRARLVPVVLGGRNGNMAWLRGTLAPGTQVIVYPPPAVRDGVRIAARKV